MLPALRWWVQSYGNPRVTHVFFPHSHSYQNAFADRAAPHLSLQPAPVLSRALTLEGEFGPNGWPTYVNVSESQRAGAAAALRQAALPQTGGLSPPGQLQRVHLERPVPLLCVRTRRCAHSVCTPAALYPPAQRCRRRRVQVSSDLIAIRRPAIIVGPGGVHTVRNLFMDNLFIPRPSSPRGRAGLPNIVYSAAAQPSLRHACAGAPCLLLRIAPQVLPGPGQAAAQWPAAALLALLLLLLLLPLLRRCAP